jgi:hypothetical protein
MGRYSTGSSGGIYQPSASPGSEGASPGLTSVQGLWGCLSDVSAGDLVQISGEQFVEKANVTSVPARHIIGFVYQKPTTTTCTVVYSGEVTLSGLSSGEDYFATSTPGGISTTRPATGYVQQVGKAKGSNVLVISIHKRVIL